MRQSTRLVFALSSIALIAVLGCGDDPDSSAIDPNPSRDQAPACVENTGSPALLSLEIEGGFGGLQDYTILLERSGRMTVSCASGAETKTQLSESVLREILSARRRARLDHLEPEYLGEGADGFDYVLTDLGCSQPIRIHTDDYAMPEPLVDLITLVASAAFDARHPFDQDCN